MKKQFFYAALAIALMSSCSKDNDPGITPEPENPTPDVIDDTKPVAIELGIGKPSVTVTRGTGSVGDLVGEVGNVWNKQELQIFMTEKGSMTEATDKGAAFFDGETFEAPSGTASGLITFKTGNVKYYPLTGKYDFYGYHIDADDATKQETKTAESIIVTATIDGTNDIMAATTMFSSADSVALINTALQAKGVTDRTYAVVDKKTIASSGTAITANAEDLALLQTELAKAYSSYAARRGVQPNLIFKHMMSRLKFNVKAGEEKASVAYYTGANEMTPHKFPDNYATLADGEYDASTTSTEADMKDGAVYVQSITVTGQKSGISLTFTPNAAPVLVGTGEATGAFILKNRPTANDPAAELVDLVPVAPANAPTGDVTPVGESMMILSGETSFTVEIKVMQYVQTNDGSGTGIEAYKWKLSTMTSTVNAPAGADDGKYAVGKSYRVNITVYGYQKIEVTATLDGWIDGGDIPVNPEDEAFGN